MKNSLQTVLFLSLSAFFCYSEESFCQKKSLSLQKRKEMMAAAQDLFYRYQTGLLADWSDTSEVNAFRACFAEDALIYDDIAPDTASRDMERNFRFKQSSLRGHSTRGVKALFDLHTALFSRDTSQSHRLSAEIRNANFNFAPLENGSISVVYSKETNGVTNFGAQRMSERDTLLMVIDFDKNFSNPKIGKISRWEPDNPIAYFMMKPRFKFMECPGDPDCDGIYAPYDLCPNQYGLDPDGCQGQALVPGLTLSGGLMLVGQTQISSLANDRVREGAINYAKPDIKPGNNVGLKIGAEYDSWFGRYKNYGFGFGAFYVGSVGTMTVTNNNLSYLDNESHQQTVTVAKATERVTYHNLSLPFLLKFSGRKLSTKRYNYFINAGAFLLVGIQGSSRANMDDANYEVKYGSTPNGNFTESTNTAKGWEISEVRLNELNKNVNENQLSDANKKYLERHRKAGYNVAANVSTSNQKDNFSRIGGLGFLMRVGVISRLSRKTNLLVCGEFMYLNNPAKPKINYQMTQNASNPDYNTFMAASNSMGQWSFGFTAAYQFKLYKKRAKN